MKLDCTCGKKLEPDHCPGCGASAPDVVDGINWADFREGAEGECRACRTAVVIYRVAPGHFAVEAIEYLE